MASTEQTKIEVLLDGRQASDQLKDLTKQAASMKMALAKAFEANDAGKVAEAEWELEKLNNRMKLLRKESVDVTKVLKNLSGATLTELRSAMSSVDSRLNGKKVKKYSEEWQILVDTKKKLVSQYQQTRKEISGTDSALTKSSNILNKHNLLLGATATLLFKLQMEGRKSLQSFNNFEDGYQNLSSLTGLVGDELEYLKDMAKDTSTATLEGGIKVRQGATAIIDAYTMIGSQRPELLKNKEALHSVTTEAIILSEAAKMDLKPAAAALTMSLSQFNASAADARRYINVLAAGSQEGAGDIAYLTDAIEKSGTTANLMGLQFEQLVGLIETVAPKYSEAAVAGNSLDKVLLTMKQHQIGYRNGVFDVNVALDELAYRFDKGESAIDIFEKAHSKMVEILVASRGDLKQYTEAVTGTNTAITQAATNTDTNKVKTQQYLNQLEKLRIEIGEKLTPGIGLLTRGGISMLKVTSALLDVANKYGWTLSTLILTLTALAAKEKLLHGYEVLRNAVGRESVFQGRAKILSMQSQIAALKVQAAMTGTATMQEKRHIVAIQQKIAATKASNAALAKTPWGVIAVGITLATGLLIDFVKNMNAAKKSAQEARVEIEAEQASANRLFEAYKKTNEGTKERAKVIAMLQEKYGPYLQGMIDEHGNLINIKEAQDAVNEALARNLALKMKEEKASEISKKYIEKQVRGLSILRERLAKAKDEKGVKIGDEIAGNITAGVKKIVDESKDVLGDLDTLFDRFGLKYKDFFADLWGGYAYPLLEMRKELKAIDDEFKPLLGEDKKDTSPDPATTTTPPGGNNTPNSTYTGKDDTEALIKEQQKRLEEQKKYREEILFNAKSLLEQEDILYQERLKKAGLFGAKEENLTGEKLEALEALQKEHQAKILKITTDAEKELEEQKNQKFQQLAQARDKELKDIRADYEKELAELRIKNNQELTQEGLTAEDRKKLKEKHQEEERQLTIKYTEQVIRIMQEMLREADLNGVDFSDKIFTPEEKKKFEAEILKAREALSKLKADDADKSDTSTPDAPKARASDVDVLGMTPAKWEELFANLDTGKVKIEDMQLAVGAIMQVWGTLNDYMSASEKRQLKDFERNTTKKKAALNSQLESGQISQEKYTARLAQLDAELDAKRAEIELKQAKRQRAMAIVNIITNTALAIMKIWADVPKMDWGAATIALTAVAAGLGAAQIAMVAAQPLPGAEDGGYLNVVRQQDGKRFRAKNDPYLRGYVDQPTIITGEDGSEFVASNEAVSNPTVAPVLDVIDAAQKNGTINRLDLTRYMTVFTPGRATGGGVTTVRTETLPPVYSTPGSDPEMKQLLRENIRMMQLLIEKRFEIPWYGRGGIDEKMKKAQQYEQQTTFNR